MSERYPGLMVTARENQLPEIDNFYLDMNGIIHNCSHPNDGDVHFRISENDMFEDIFNYISTLFDIIKPREYFFLAVDGVAPRAKMNQQRGRRFRSAKEAFDREEAAMKKGDILPTEERFDSNCITPGTEFMVKLNETLKQFIQMKLATDPEWKRVKVILSGHETPGEGEHKVMDFIRYTRSQPGYNPETRHCLYGLDTDLIMLGLSSHEPNFMLLREEIKFNNKKNESHKSKSNRVDPSKINFNVLYLSLLRDYIKQDFSPLTPKLSFQFDLEAIIDDWILICFLVGNDFIPHIPHFHIHKNALPKILEVYQATLLKTDGYLNEKGILNLKRFKVFAKIMSQLDFENYRMLVKQNGGECAKDDFSKLNEFVRAKMRIHGIRRDNNYNGQNNNFDRHQRSNGRPDSYSHHSHFQQSNVWHNLQRSGNNSNSINSNARLNSSLTQAQVRPIHTSSTSKNHSYNGKATNGTPNARVGVHSFTEEQINNSITVCADGDFIDLSDEEFLSDEKFPGERGHMKQRLKNGPMNRRSTPKKDLRDRNDANKTKPHSELDDFRAYKRTYYREKFKIEPNKDSILTVVHEYVRALQWNLHYYYHGCVSWGWFYPYHYAPFISDIVNFKTVDTKFELGEPFKPYDQLLSVLPAASLSLLPKVYRQLVTSDASPLAQFFPTEVEYDLNGKQNDWEAVVLAPFIDEEALLKATVVCNLFLSKQEQAINAHGPHHLFEYVQGPRGGHVRCRQIAANGFNIPKDKIKFGLLKDDMLVMKPSQNSTTSTSANTTRNYRPYQRR